MPTPAGLLDNIVWHALVGPHAPFALGGATARRYHPDVTALAGFADPARPDLDGLRPHSGPDAVFYCMGWSGRVPDGWAVTFEAPIVKMVWDAPVPADPGGATPVPLGARDVEAALALARLTHPGPFGTRTMELGDYVGCFDGPRLVAMAGERMRAGRLREVSAVCTHPDHEGRGLARALMTHVIRRQLARGEVPCLHVLADNTRARRLYARLGFREYRETLARQLAPTSAPTAASTS